MMNPSELDGMPSSEFRHAVVQSLNRIEFGINGDGTESNPGLCGVVAQHGKLIDYALESNKNLDRRQRDAREAHNTHVAKQTTRQQAITFTLGIMTSGVAVLLFVLTIGG